MCHKITGEHNMKNKKGFTLIELMVVVVIIGILAAVAVPKLFGMIAKSKASEVGPAAGTYVKMQQAYVSEAVAIGPWDMIGYKAPGTGNKTTNFAYAGFTTGATVELATGKNSAWTATNNTKLNDCASAANWVVDVAAATGTVSAGEAVFNAVVSGTGCSELTPNFKTIGK